MKFIANNNGLYIHSRNISGTLKTMGIYFKYPFGNYNTTAKASQAVLNGIIVEYGLNDMVRWVKI